MGLLFLILVSCSSKPFPEGLNDARVGMDKDAVLNLGGNPTRTYHEKGQDHWIYDYFNEGQRFGRHIVFKDGFVVTIGPAFAKKASSDGVSEEAETPEQLEKELRQTQPEKPKGEFKDVP
jgi:outer membrane protein assembly factor BamE (lipoprotein component of BamABCDE complex)